VVHVDDLVEPGSEQILPTTVTSPSVACESSIRTQRHDGIIACGRNQFARNHVSKSPVLANMNTCPTQILSPNQGVAESSRPTRNARNRAPRSDSQSRFKIITSANVALRFAESATPYQQNQIHTRSRGHRGSSRKGFAGDREAARPAFDRSRSNSRR
jgi:hypothetical protein